MTDINLVGAKRIKILVLDHLLMVGNSHGHSSGLNIVDVVKHLPVPVAPVEYLAHCLDGSSSVVLRVESNGDNYIHHFGIPMPRLPQAIAYMVGVFHSVLYYRRRRFDVCVAVNPLNFLSAYLLKVSGCAKLIVFYSADYSPLRTRNRLLNYFYHVLDRFAATHSDASWNVSLEICEIRNKQGAKDVRHIPNAPRISQFTRQESAASNPFILVYTFPKFSGNTVQSNHMLQSLLDNFSSLRRELPLLRLRLIGLGDFQPLLRPLVRNESDLTYIDFMDVRQRDTLIQLLCDSSIGLALYDLSGGASHLRYGDSMKIREYLAAGLPVITTPGHPMANETSKNSLGYVVSTDQEFQNAVRAVYFDSKRYDELRKRAIEYSQIHNISEIVSDALCALLNNN